ncbi:hypothetical protein N3K66_006019 [Trichothecium roseum]|uniref:Uncharacterized protein n=1 Tax=Trichothecium roseum TaxID=47278 RepID=A0ACC0UZH7_9HYPO|nr:hypothetical protein N3K66_006019 [Trichothecium roseum]
MPPFPDTAGRAPLAKGHTTLISNDPPGRPKRCDCDRDVPEPQMAGVLETLYRLVMTPLNFVVFILSLFLVDMRMSIARRRNRSVTTSWLPAWVHVLVSRYQPYGGTDEYYHTKQKKLMRHEADEAFKMRNTMAIFLIVSTLCLFVGGIWVMRTAYQHLVAH